MTTNHDYLRAMLEAAETARVAFDDHTGDMDDPDVSRERYRLQTEAYRTRHEADVAALNALPGLLDEIKTYREALGNFADNAEEWWVRDRAKEALND